MLIIPMFIPPPNLPIFLKINITLFNFWKILKIEKVVIGGYRLDFVILKCSEFQIQEY